MRVLRTPVPVACEAIGAVREARTAKISERYLVMSIPILSIPTLAIGNPGVTTPVVGAPLFLALPGPTELWVILAVMLLFVGGRKLPELARAMGSSITQFKKGMREEPPSLTESEEASNDT